MKVCPRCKQELADEAFGHRPYGPKHSYCKICRLAYAKEHHRKNRERNLASSHRSALRLRYNTTPEKVEAKRIEQNNKCAICSCELTRPHIDHSHLDNKFRGLLCFNCNGGLGQFKDNITSLENAIAYLKANL